jgi:hypothetical protein
VNNSKINLAFEKFKEEYNRLKFIISWSDYCCPPYPDEENFLSTYVSGDCDRESASKFFDLIQEHLADNNLGVDKTDGSSAESLSKEMRETFEKVIEKEGSYYSYCGIYHLAVCVAVGLACYYFVSENTRMSCVFNRDKWESRGDYCSEFKAAFEIDQDRNGEYAYEKEFEPFSYM